MLEWERDREGRAVPKWNGNLLASKQNPEREADSWLQRQKDKIVGAEFIFVLGFGAGYHVRALREYNRSLNIIVIETITAIAESNVSKDIKVFTPQTPNEIFEIQGISEILSSPFAIIKHGPSCRASPEKYNEIEGFLTARDPRSLLLHLQFRTSDKKFFEDIAFPSVKKKGFVDVKNASFISIKDILQSVSSSKDLSEEARIWMALGELIK